MFNKSKYVYVIYKEGSYTAAAKKLGVSQPCLSAAVKLIETKLGMPIFERAGGELRPTSVGYEYIKTAETLARLEENFSLRISEIGESVRGTVRVGCSQFALLRMFPQITAELEKRYPNISILITEADSERLIECVRSGELDIIIDSFISEPQGCRVIPFLDEKLLLAAPILYKGDKAFERYCASSADIYSHKTEIDKLAQVPLEAFKDCMFVLPLKGTQLRRAVDRIFERNGFSPKEYSSVSGLLSAYHMSDHGGCCSFITDTLLKFSEPLSDLKLYNFSGSTHMTFGAAYRKDKHVSRAMQTFIDIFLDFISEPKEKQDAFAK